MKLKLLRVQTNGLFLSVGTSWVPRQPLHVAQSCFVAELSEMWLLLVGDTRCLHAF